MATVAMLIALLPAKFPGARAPSDAEATQELTELEQRWLTHENEPQVLESILADDFIHVLPSGFVTKVEHIAYVREHPTINTAGEHFENLRVRVYGSVGIVNGVVVARSSDGSERRTLFTDVFAQRNGKWQAVNAQELPLAAKQ
jgi:hypothetical protein